MEVEDVPECMMEKQKEMKLPLPAMNCLTFLRVGDSDMRMKT
jgi:hypothetical protein